jgi:hypothetical protein
MCGCSKVNSVPKLENLVPTPIALQQESTDNNIGIIVAIVLAVVGVVLLLIAAIFHTKTSCKTMRTKTTTLEPNL